METSEYQEFKKLRVRRKASVQKNQKNKQAEVRNPVLRERIDTLLKTGYVLIRSNCVLKKTVKKQNHGTL